MPVVLLNSFKFMSFVFFEIVTVSGISFKSIQLPLNVFKLTINWTQFKGSKLRRVDLANYGWFSKNMHFIFCITNLQTLRLQ